MAKAKVKVYESNWIDGSLEEWEEFDKLKAKVLDCLDHSLIFGGHTIPEIAKDIGEDEQRVADVLYDLCSGHHPQVLIASAAWEEWFRKLRSIESAYPQPFTNKTKFYSWIAR
jgi:hypothetical protein